MNWKHLIKQLTPPIVLHAYRSLGNPYRRGYLWSGTYPSMDDITAKGAGYHGSVWLDSRLDQAKTVISAPALPDAVPLVSGFRYGSLVLLTALFGATKEYLRILDFGGALGIAYAQILRSAYLPPHFEFHVVDNRESCINGRKLFSADPRISFHESLDESVGKIDIVFLSGVLQYIRDYKGTLKVLAGLRPSFILMTYTSAGNIQTFASAQVNLRGSVIPAWFFSVQEITDLMNVLGYRVLLKLSVDPEDRIDTSNLASERRLTHMAALLFSPKTSSQV